MSGTRYPIECARCGGRLRWRRITDRRYEPPQEWRAPARCSHCGAKSAPGSLTIWVRESVWTGPSAHRTGVRTPREGMK